MSILKRHDWNFPSNNFGQIFGIADSGIETFNGTPIKSLAREICQNSIDANLQNGKPTHIVFRTFKISPNAIPGFSSLKDAFNRSLEYWSNQYSKKAEKFFQSALHLANQTDILCLRISDYNTTGLLGSDKEYNSPWCNLTKSQGASDKSGSHGGSFGIGKFAPFACSMFRTVFYSTLDSNGIEASQGVARLTSFKNKNNETTQGIGFYGEKKNTPMKKQLSLDPSYKRPNGASGTDIFILGFHGKKGWKQEIIASILDGFLYAVLSGELCVDVENIEISQKTLPKLIESDNLKFEEHADEYYQVLTTSEKKSPKYTKEFPNLGLVTLRLMIHPNFHRRVAMVRKTGMKIMDKGNINGLIPFAGVLYIQGDRLNEYLKNLENPQHTKWEIDRAEKKSEAKKLIADLTKFIKKSLEELKDDDSEEEIDPSVGEYLPYEQDENKKQPENNGEAINDIVSNIEVRTVPDKTENNTVKKTSVDPNIDTSQGNPILPNTPPKSKHRKRSSIISNGSHGERGNPGNQINISVIPISQSRLMCLNKDSGEYMITLVPSVSAANGSIDLFMSAESQNYEATIISAKIGNTSLPVIGNKICNIKFTKNTPLKISVKIKYQDYCSMEVKAYENFA
jgi:hypothetical protein